MAMEFLQAIIVGGGNGTRMGGEQPKQFLKIRNRTILEYTLDLFYDFDPHMTIILVLPETYLEYGYGLIQSYKKDRIKIIPGGRTRFHSVQNAVLHLKKKGIVFVHDMVRCLASPKLLHRCYNVAVEKGNAVPCVLIKESVRMIDDNHNNKYINRNKLRSIQTPQTFYAEMLIRAFEQPYEETFTDEANVVEKLGEKIHLIYGEISNIKITTPEDLLLVTHLLTKKI